jgi:hypothetical protein
VNLDEIKANKLRVAVLLIVALLGVVLILFQTRYGPGTTGDSVRYLMGTENLLQGNGFSRTSGGGEIRPITMFPPFYSVVLLGVKVTGVEFFDGIRLLQALLFGVNIFLAGLIILRYTKSIWAAIIGSTFVLVAKEVVFYHSFVLTEAVYILLMFVTLLGLVQFLESRKSSLLVLLGIVVGAATLTRYVGLSLTVGVVLSILLLSDESLRRRLMDCLIFGAISVAPVLLWLRRNAIQTGTSVNRAFVFHPMSTELIRAYRAEVSYWFVPKQLHFPHSLRKALMLIMAIPGPALFFFDRLKVDFLSHNRSKKPFWPLPWVISIFMISYIGLVFFNLTFLDAISDFNTVSRYLVPVYIDAVILFVIVFHRLTDLPGKWVLLRGVVVVLGLALIVLYGIETYQILKDPLSSIGYSGLKQQRPETVEMLESIDTSVPIISNDPEMIYIFVNRPAYLLPLQIDYHTTMEREDFDQQFSATKEKLLDGGVVVLFSPMTESELQVVELLDAELLDVFYGSSFYGYPEVIAE